MFLNSINMDCMTRCRNRIIILLVTIIVVSLLVTDNSLRGNRHVELQESKWGSLLSNTSIDPNALHLQLQNINSYVSQNTDVTVVASNGTEFFNETGKLNASTELNSTRVLGTLQSENTENKTDVSKKDEEIQTENYEKLENWNSNEEADSIKNSNQKKDPYSCNCKVVNSTKLKGHSQLIEQLRLIDPEYKESTERVLNEQHPNIPLEMMKSKRACSSLPRLQEIMWNADYWQIFLTKSSVRYSLYSAFYDNRRETDEGPVVYILALRNSPKSDTMFCNIWFSEDEAPMVSKVNKFQHLDYQEPNNKRLLPYILTCPLPKNSVNRVPKAVSLTVDPCGPFTNLLRVIGERGRNFKQSVEKNLNGKDQWRVGVCGPALYYYFEDMSIRLVDWIETLKAIGVSKVYLYETDSHPNISKVLRHYESENFIETTMFSYPEPYINQANLRRYWTLTKRPEMFSIENIYFTDCVLRHKDQLRFLVHMDPDEMMMMENGKSISELMGALLEKNNETSSPAAYNIFSTFYPENMPPGPQVLKLPEYLYILRHSQHFKDIKKHQAYGFWKSIYDTDYVKGVFSHNVLYCNKDPCRVKSQKVKTSLAHLAHVRSECKDDCQKKEQFVESETLLKHKDRIEENVKAVLTTLGLL